MQNNDFKMQKVYFYPKCWFWFKKLNLMQNVDSKSQFWSKLSMFIQNILNESPRFDAQKFDASDLMPPINQHSFDPKMIKLLNCRLCYFPKARILYFKSIFFCRSVWFLHFGKPSTDHHIWFTICQQKSSWIQWMGSW